jgi:uncharacterized protein YbjT (DUF2867 family)
MREETLDMAIRIVTVVGASGTLGSQIVRALLEKGARVRAMVRESSDRTKLESLGVTDFEVADLMDATSLQRALNAEPRAEAVVASAAGFTAHSARTKGDNSRTDTEGYRNLVDAAKNAGVPRVILISILECDKAPDVPHFSQKFVTEKYLAEKGQPYLALRAGAFLDRGRDVVAERVRKGVFPDIVPGVALDMIYSPDLARYAAEAALDLPASVLNQSVDVRCNVPATGPMVAAAFTRILGRPVVAKPVVPLIFVTLLPLLAWFVPRLRDQVAVLAWIRKGGYVSHESQKQKELFGELPTIEDSVARYCRDRGLIEPR